MKAILKAKVRARVHTFAALKIDSLIESPHSIELVKGWLSFGGHRVYDRKQSAIGESVLNDLGKTVAGKSAADCNAVYILMQIKTIRIIADTMPVEIANL